MRIAVIAGHSTAEPGARGSLDIPPTAEHGIVLEITQYLIGKLDAAGIDWFSLSGTLQEKVKACNKLGVDLALEIHLNAVAVGDGYGYGAECLIYSAGKRNTVYFIASQIVTKLANLGLRHRGAKERKDLYFLRKTHMPAIIVECYFLDNKAEADKYMHQTEEIATAIFEGIKEWQT